MSCSENKVLFVFNRYKVKNYVPNKPFVFANKVIVSGNIKKDELKRLTLELNNYWHDSLQVKRVTQFGFFEKIKNPPVFDTANISKSAKLMNAYLNSQGYYYATILEASPAKIDTVKDQLRTSVTMMVDVGKNITIDSVSYNLTDGLHQTPKDTALQMLAIKNYPTSFLKKGTAYSKQIVSDELDKLVILFRQNGYYKFTREHIYALVDSTNESLFKLTLDPISLAKLIAKAEAERKKNPVWDITIKQRNSLDSSRLNQFYIGKIYNDQWMMERGFLDVKTIREIINSRGTKRLITIEPDQTVTEAVEMMKKFDIEQIPVMENDKPIGGISQHGLFKKVFADSSLKTARIREVMEPVFPLVPFDSPAEKLAQYISKENGAVLTKDEAGTYHIVTKYDVISALGNA